VIGENVIMEQASAYIGGRWATDLLDVSSDADVLTTGDRWVLLMSFEGEARYFRFARWGDHPPADIGMWRTDPARIWESSLEQHAYIDAVESIRSQIARGDFYQVNLCRILRSADTGGDPRALFLRTRQRNPSPYAAYLVVPELDIAVVSASPERFLRRHGRSVLASPIKGTARNVEGLLPKDHAENVMIVDLMRNDLGRTCIPGSIHVPALCEIETHPGLVHLVSHVSGTLGENVSWAKILDTTWPPGSVSGAPKSAAVRAIEQWEPVPRSWYCGALGYVEQAGDIAELSVNIRIFWRANGVWHFGTGAGITWGSDAAQEWAETELKAARLLAVMDEDS